MSFLRKVAMGDEEIVVETIKVFIESTPNVLENLKQHFTNKEWEKLSNQAHKVKPNLKYMGMERAHELILEIEEQAKSQNISDDLGDKIEEFNLVCSQGIEELSEKVEKLES